MPQAIPDRDYPGYSIWDAEHLGLGECIIVFTGQLTRPENDVNSVVVFGTTMRELLYIQGAFYYVRAEVVDAVAAKLALEAHTQTLNSSVLYDARGCDSMDRTCWGVLAVHTVDDDFKLPEPVLPIKP